MKQKRIVPLILIFLLFLTIIPFPAQAEESVTDGREKLILTQGSTQIIHNGVTVLATQPLTAVKGVTYVAARSFMKEIYGKVVFNAKTKQYVLSNGATELRFTVGDTSYLLDGIARNDGIGAPFVTKGTLMVPVRTLAKSFGLTLKNYPKEKKIELAWDSKPAANFSVSSTDVYAAQTEVYYTDLSYHASGLQIIDERWENNLTIFDQPGTYTVSHWVQAENGIWSDPYTVTITVKPQNQPPQAYFSTVKDSYKMGELIEYVDQSTDDENRIVSRVWTNNERGFFVPGQQTITLKVTDALGEISEYAKTITIENETMHRKEEFDLLYTPIGGKFVINSRDVLRIPNISYSIMPQAQTYIRANSPETILEEGIYYEDTVAGNVRFLVHNINRRSVPVKIYIIATNENPTDANVVVGPVGIGGPNPYVSSTGKAAVGRFLSAQLSPQFSETQIPAGQSRIIIPEFSEKVVKAGNVYSMYADVQMDAMLKVQVVVVNAEREVFSMLPYLPVLPSDDQHIRGTFEDANRLMIVDETIGDLKSRMVLADNIVDTRLPGVDRTTETPVLNAGNYGTLYTIILNNVKPHTAIAVNPRGGYYAGAFIINGQVVFATTDSTLANPNEVGMLHRTGDTPETVTITFTPAAGSSLPINLLFLPLPN